MPFEAIRPLIHNTLVPGTAMSAELRTTTAKGLSGGASEIPWINKNKIPIIAPLAKDEHNNT